MSDDTPTQRFDAQPPVPSGQNSRSRLPLILGIAGGALLVIVIVLLVLLLGRTGSAQNAAISGPTTTPSTTPSTSALPTTPPDTSPPSADPPHTLAPPPPPKSTDAAFTKFVVQKEINSCSGGPYYTGTPPTVDVTWATIRADSAWIVQGTSDAADSQFMQIPLNGNQSNFQYSIDFACGSANGTYTITLVGSNGKHVSRSWTIKNTSPGP
jgi:hypothetical protein